MSFYLGLIACAAALIATSFAFLQYLEKRELRQETKQLKRENDYLRSLLGL